MYMKIKIYSDIACPFCYVGKKRLFRVLKEKFSDLDVDIEYAPFQLNPNLPEVASGEYIEGLMRNYGTDRAGAQAMFDRTNSFAAVEGIQMNFEDIVNVNTFNAHRLITYAQTKGEVNELYDNLMVAYFVDGKSVADIDELIEIGVASGLDRDELTEVMKSDKYVQETKTNLLVSQNSGVRSVPLFVFDDHYSISGAQPDEAFIDVINATIAGE